VELKRVDDGEKGFEKVFAFLRDRLLAGSLKPGDRLVSERDLAIQLGVGRPLVREALRALTMLGIVEIRDRIGTVVTRPDVSVLNDFFTFALAQQADMPDDVMQARVAIECQAIRLACERADIADSSAGSAGEDRGNDQRIGRRRYGRLRIPSHDGAGVTFANPGRPA
jgi:DNA-binding FadR family transcriptional regulator